MKIFKIIKKIIIIIALSIVGYSVLGNFSALNNSLYNIVHYRNYVVLTGSMEPSILPGDYITIFKVNKDKLKVGDVITYSKDEKAVTHKIISIDNDKVTTQGTANNLADEPISKDDIIGKYIFKVPKVGYVMQFMSSPSGLILIFGFIGIAIFWEATDPKKGKVSKEVGKDAHLTSKTVIREMIFENLTELGRISKEDVNIIESEEDISILKEWSRKSVQASSVEEFFKELTEGSLEDKSKKESVEENLDVKEIDKWNVSENTKRKGTYTCSRRSSKVNKKSKH